MNNKDSDKDKKDFLENYKSVLSHQLKSPINSIQSMLNTIYQGYTGELSPKTKYFIEKSINKADEAKNLIIDILDYEYYSQGEKGNKNEIDILKFLKTLIDKYIPVVSEKNISLNTDLPDDIQLIIMGNRKALDLTFRNLIENAIKYTPEQGYISAILKYDENKKECSITISDTGYGIAEDELENIFTPFYRSITHKANTPGTGLGLAIVKSIVNAHDGTISVNSVLKEGTVFNIVLPLLRKDKSEKNDKIKKRVIIIGGVTAGPKVGARLRRLDEDIDIIIIEKGEYLSYSGCGLPSYISNKVRSPRALMSTSDNTLRDIEFFKVIKNIRILNKTEVTEIDRKNKKVKIKDLITNNISDLDYDKLVIGTGANSFIPDIPGIDNEGIYSLYNITDAENIRRKLSSKKARDVFIIGGGLVGIETAEALIYTGARVTILEKLPRALGSFLDKCFAEKIQNELSKKGIKIITSINIEKIEKMENSLFLKTNKGEFTADLIIISAGEIPNSDLAKKAGLKIGNHGGIIVDKYLRTSDENIYAVGDCTENLNLITRKYEYWPLGSIATKMGRICADNIYGFNTEINGYIGTAMFTVFETNIARTGLTSDNAEKRGFEIESVVISGLDKSHYTDHAKYIFLKLITDKKTRIIIGAQGFGSGDVISRISIIASAISNNMTLEDIFKLDLGYHPAYNNPIDILQTACLVLINKLNGHLKTVTLMDLNNNDYKIMDVSPLTEHTFKSIPESINIPLENIRAGDIPFDKNAKIFLYSKTSAGAYEAYRNLISKGYENIYVLEGGLLFWEK